MLEPMAKPRPLPRSAAFEWNGGAWAGTTFGGSIWLLFGSIVLFGLGYPLAGLVWMLCFGGAVSIGLALWQRRRRMRPHPAAQMLVWGIAGLAVLALAALVLTGAETALEGMTYLGTAEIWLVVLVFPLLSILFLAKERRAARNAPR